MKPVVTGAAATLLKASCHSLHMLLVAFGLFGWIVPTFEWLVAHIIFLPSLIVIWRLNGNSCPLNNFESWLTSGEWRRSDDREQGTFLLTLVEKYLRLRPNQKSMDQMTYAFMMGAWLLSWMHLAHLQGIFLKIS